MVDGVGIMLGFQAEAAGIAGVKLHCGFSGAQFHDPPALRITHPRGQDQGLAASVDDEIVVVNAGLGLELAGAKPEQHRHREIQRRAVTETSEKMGIPVAIEINSKPGFY